MLIKAIESKTEVYTISLSETCHVAYYHDIHMMLNSIYILRLLISSSVKVDKYTKLATLTNICYTGGALFIVEIK